MSSTLSDQTTPATDETGTAAPKAPARTARRWPWIVALVAVAALGATGTGIAAASASSAQSELAVVQENYADLETRAEISQSSLTMMRDQRDRLELQVEELQEQLDAAQ